MVQRLSKALFITLIACATPDGAQAECTALVKGAMAIDVHSCSIVEPEKFDTSKDQFKVIRDLDPEGRNKLLNSYRGLSVRATVSRSKAIKSGLSTEKGALQGDSIQLFLPSSSGLSCQQIANKRIAGAMNETCCDGRPESPCLLNTSYVFEKAKIIGDAKVTVDGKALDSARTNKKMGPKYKAAEALYFQKKYKEAANAYREADAAGETDVKGLFRWGNAYRELEDCKAAIQPLKKIYDLHQASKIWKEDELDARRGIFLLARCHSKLNEPSDAVFYLNGFLLDPKKYQAEIKQSLIHKDFGWIHTSKEYREYRESVKTQLGY